MAIFNVILIPVISFTTENGNFEDFIFYNFTFYLLIHQNIFHVEARSYPHLQDWIKWFPIQWIQIHYLKQLQRMLLSLKMKIVENHSSHGRYCDSILIFNFYISIITTLIFFLFSVLDLLTFVLMYACSDFYALSRVNN